MFNLHKTNTIGSELLFSFFFSYFFNSIGHKYMKWSNISRMFKQKLGWWVTTLLIHLKEADAVYHCLQLWQHKSYHRILQEKV